MVQEMLGICEAKNGTETSELLQAGTDGHTRAWGNVEKFQVLEDGRVPATEATN